MREQRKNSTNDHKKRNREKAKLGKLIQELKHLRILLDVGYSIFDEVEADKQDTKPNHRLREVTQFLASKKHKGKEESDQNHRYRGNLHFEPKYGNNPRGNRRTNIGAHNNAGGLHKRNQPCVDETHNHHGCSR